MPQYRLSPPVHKSDWCNIWEGIKNAWRAAGLFGKLTFVFTLTWSLLVLGFLRKSIKIILVALGLGVVAGVVIGLAIWGMLEGGYKIFLHPITILLAISWILALVTYRHLKRKYPGKYGTLFGYNTHGWIVRSIPILTGILATLIFITAYLVKPFLWWILGGAGAIVGVVVIYYVVKSLISGSSDEVTRKAKEILVLAISLTVALGVINWLLWTLDEELWGSVWATASRFWAINLGILLAILLLFVAKGADNKPHPVAKTFSKIIGGLVAAILIVCLWDFMTGGKDWKLWANQPRDVVSITRVENRSHSVPMEIALAIIADHESGDGTPGSGKQFLPGTIIPVRNPSNAGPGKGAVGKWQINLSDPDTVEELKILEAEMKKDGRLKKDESLDVEGNESHNEAAARYLFAKYGTRPWNASRTGWEPKLRAYTWGGEAVSLVVMAPKDRPSEKVVLPARQIPVKADFSGGGRRYVVIYNDGMPNRTEETMPLEEGVPSQMPRVVYNMRYQSVEAEPIPITVKIY